jgi:hypothetical protein
LVQAEVEPLVVDRESRDMKVSLCLLELTNSSTATVRESYQIDTVCQGWLPQTMTPNQANERIFTSEQHLQRAIRVRRDKWDAYNERPVRLSAPE